MTGADKLEFPFSNRHLRWPIWLAVIGIVAATVLVFNAAYFNPIIYLLTFFTFVIFSIAIRRRPTSVTSQILYFQIFLLTALYPIKGMRIVWQLEAGAYNVLPAHLYFGLQSEQFSVAYVTSCITIIFLALFLISLPLGRPKKMDVFTKLNSNRLIGITVAFFVGSLVLRLFSIGGLAGSVVYVLNHRGTHFAFALLIYILVRQNRSQVARHVFYGWLALGVVQFLLFASKSYIFLPVISLLIIYLFCNVLIIRGSLAVLVSAVAVMGYPVLNLYRSILRETSLELMEVSSAFALYNANRGGNTLWEMIPIYFDQVVNRFVGIEWYLTVIQAHSRYYLSDAGSPMDNIFSISDTMRALMGRDGEMIGIAPSFLGGVFLVVRDPYLTPVLALAFCFIFVLLYKTFALVFPRVGDAVTAPLALIIFSVVTDGLVTSLYWDVPALIIVCVLFSTCAPRTRSLHWTKYA